MYVLNVKFFIWFNQVRGEKRIFKSKSRAFLFLNNRKICERNIIFHFNFSIIKKKEFNLSISKIRF
jgi:hypothetical protein